MAAIIRLKRKACDEPADGLLIALKKSKCVLSNSKEVLFKFAATLNSSENSVKDQIQAALLKERTKKFTKWRNPKNTAMSESTLEKLSERLRADRKNAKEKNKLDFLNNRRLILAEEFQDLEDSVCKDAEVRRLFHLYDIIEENEEMKKQKYESVITCNDTPLIREKVDEFVFDVYIADGNVDHTFINETVSVRPYTLTSDDIYSGDSGDSDECYDDEDDSNDESNWRNEYPEDEESHSEEERNSDGSSYSEKSDDDGYREEVHEDFRAFVIDDSGDEDYIRGSVTFDYENVMKDLEGDDVDSD